MNETGKNETGRYETDKYKKYGCFGFVWERIIASEQVRMSLD